MGQQLSALVALAEDLVPFPAHASYPHLNLMGTRHEHSTHTDTQTKLTPMKQSKSRHIKNKYSWAMAHTSSLQSKFQGSFKGSSALFWVPHSLHSRGRHSAIHIHTKKGKQSFQKKKNVIQVMKTVSGCPHLGLSPV